MIYLAFIPSDIKFSFLSDPRPAFDAILAAPPRGKSNLRPKTAIALKSNSTLRAIDFLSRNNHVDKYDYFCDRLCALVYESIDELIKMN